MCAALAQIIYGEIKHFRDIVCVWRVHVHVHVRVRVLVHVHVCECVCILCQKAAKLESKLCLPK